MFVEELDGGDDRHKVAKLAAVKSCQAHAIKLSAKTRLGSGYFGEQCSTRRPSGSELVSPKMISHFLRDSEFDYIVKR